MSRVPFIVIDGKLYRWKGILELRRAQKAAAAAGQASQMALLTRENPRLCRGGSSSLTFTEVNLAF